jgi:hypothetical protein
MGGILPPIPQCACEQQICGWLMRAQSRYVGPMPDMWPERKLRRSMSGITWTKSFLQEAQSRYVLLLDCLRDLCRIVPSGIIAGHVLRAG